MHELNSNFAAIGLAVGSNQLTQLPDLLALADDAVVGHVDGELALHICLSEAVVGRVEHGKKSLIREAEFL